MPREPREFEVVSAFSPTGDQPQAIEQLSRDLLGGAPQEVPAQARAASPLFSADRESAPTLFITGADDPLVAPDQSERMADALRAAHVETTAVVVYKQGHAFLNPADPQTYGAMAVEWLTRHLKP